MIKQTDVDKIIVAVDKQIRITVNSKIEKLSDKLDKHIEESRPAMDVYNTANNVGKFVKWIAGILLATGLLYTYIKGWLL